MVKSLLDLPQELLNHIISLASDSTEADCLRLRDASEPYTERWIFRKCAQCA